MDPVHNPGPGSETPGNSVVEITDQIVIVKV